MNRLTRCLIVSGFSVLCVVATASFAYAQPVPILALQNVEEDTGTTVSMEIVLVDAPAGLQQFNFIVTVSNAEIATIEAIQAGLLNGNLFQTKSITPSSAQFLALDLHGEIQPGATNVLLGRVILNAVATGDAQIVLQVNAYIDDGGVKVEPEVRLGQLSINTPLTDAAPPIIPHVPSVISPAASAPQDLDDDGLFEDINGDGFLSADDGAILLSNLDNETVQNELECYDFNRDGRLDKDDVIVLLQIVPDTLVPRDAPAGQTIIQMSEQNADPGSTVIMDVRLEQAPEGLETFYMRIKLHSPEVARIVGLQSGAVDKAYLQIISQTSDEIYFRGADLDQIIQNGYGNGVLARLELEILAPGTTQLEVVVEKFTGDGNRTIQPVVSEGLLSVARAVSALDSSLNPPNDLDGDGLFEDVNGDGILSGEDAILLAFNESNPVVVDQAKLFDFNHDGQFTFEDAQALATMI